MKLNVQYFYNIKIKNVYSKESTSQLKTNKVSLDAKKVIVVTSNGNEEILDEELKVFDWIVIHISIINITKFSFMCMILTLHAIIEWNKYHSLCSS